MAHEIYENDQMFSVREVPWHGLGNIIEDYPSIEEAKKASGLWWTASLERMKVPMHIHDMDVDIEVPNQFAIVRNDIHHVLGVVGNRYEIYQNDDMWSFIEEFQKQSGIKLETAGSLRNGQMTWVLGKNQTPTEILKGDPIEQYFLFRNAFDGSTPISTLFTNIRVVCNNTLTAALSKAKNMFNVRHTSSAEEQMKEVAIALGIAHEYHGQMKDVLIHFSKYKMGVTKTEKFIEEEIFPIPTTTDQEVGEGDQVKSLVEMSKQAETLRNKKIEAVLDLIESGAGTNIKGVRGTAYGVYQALTEYSDHEKTIKTQVGRRESEVRFENSFFGTNARFKNDCFQKIRILTAA